MQSQSKKNTLAVLLGRLVGRFVFISDYTICLYPHRVYFESNNIRH